MIVKKKKYLKEIKLISPEVYVIICLCVCARALRVARASLNDCAHHTDTRTARLAGRRRSNSPYLHALFSTLSTSSVPVCLFGLLIPVCSSSQSHHLGAGIFLFLSFLAPPSSSLPPFVPYVDVKPMNSSWLRQWRQWILVKAIVKAMNSSSKRSNPQKQVRPECVHQNKRH